MHIRMRRMGWTALTLLSVSLGACAQVPSPTLIPPDMVMSGGVPKDGIPALTDSEHVRASRVRAIAGDSRVVGVELHAEARAYPLNILVWHECINDTLGGVPIAVTYCPLCDSAFVFDRRVGGEVREFGVSGLLFQSNVLLYDRQPAEDEESLWSQVQMRAVAGPAAAKRLRLRPIDSALMDWRAWRDRSPETTVISTDTGYERSYGASHYGGYFATDRLMFPVRGRTGRRPDLANKDRVVVVSVGNARKAYPVRDLAAASRNTLVDRLGGQRIAVTLDESSGAVDAVAVDDAGNPLEDAPAIRRAYSFWFAWDAMHPQVAVYQP